MGSVSDLLRCVCTVVSVFASSLQSVSQKTSFGHVNVSARLSTREALQVAFSRDCALKINVDTFLLEEFEQFFYKRASEPPDQSQNEVLISAEGCFLIHSLRL